MGIVSNIMKKLQEARLENPYKYDEFNKGFLAGVSKAEEIIFAESKKLKNESNGLWYTGSPNDIKPNNRGTFIVIMKAGFDSDDGVEKGKIYIDTDFWNGEEWEGYEVGEGKWEVLYFTKLKWIKFPLPEELGIKRTDSLFFD